MADVKECLKELIKEHAGVGIGRMVDHSEISHSFDMLRPACDHQPAVVYTFMMLLIPDRLGEEVYEALRPIMERDGRVGTLVKPGSRARKMG